MIRLHNYRDGAVILINLDNAQYVTSTTYKDADGNEAKAIVTYSDETCFYVKESLEEIDALRLGRTVEAQGADVGELPPMPDPRAIRAGEAFPKVYALAYTANQMRDYARAALKGKKP